MLYRGADILILDEPTNGLDIEATVEIREIIIRLAKEKGVNKCIAMLIASRVVERTAESIVKFIFLYLPQLDETELGDYLGSDGGTTREQQALMDQIRYRFLRGVWRAE